MKYYPNRSKQIWINLRRYFANRKDFLQLYNNVVVYWAYEIFRHNACSDEDYHREFKNKISCFFYACSSLKIKVFSLISAIFSKNVIYKFYLLSKRMWSTL